MGALKSQRQERFCQLIKQGVPAFRAYPQAGYAANNGAPYRLAENVRVKARIAELTRSIAVKTRVTIASLSEQIIEDREFARQHDNPSAAHAATVSLSKLHGFMVERKEVGQPGDFAGLNDAQVREKLLAEHGPEAVELLERFLQASQGQREAIENEPKVTRKVDEVERSLELLGRR
jgi:hypothetical protein